MALSKHSGAPPTIVSLENGKTFELPTPTCKICKHPMTAELIQLRKYALESVSFKCSSCGRRYEWTDGFSALVSLAIAVFLLVILWDDVLFVVYDTRTWWSLLLIPLLPFAVGAFAYLLFRDNLFRGRFER